MLEHFSFQVQFFLSVEVNKTKKKKKTGAACHVTEKSESVTYVLWSENFPNARILTDCFNMLILETHFNNDYTLFIITTNNKRGTRQVY